VIAIPRTNIGIELRGVISDNGPEFAGKAFTTHLAEIGITHHRIPARSPNHNAVCERVQGTILQEFYRPAFHRQRFDTLAELDTQLQGFLTRYNTKRRNHGAYMSGRVPVAGSRGSSSIDSLRVRLSPRPGNA